MNLFFIFVRYMYVHVGQLVLQIHTQYLFLPFLIWQKLTENPMVSDVFEQSDFLVLAGNLSKTLLCEDFYYLVYQTRTLLCTVHLP